MYLLLTLASLFARGVLAIPKMSQPMSGGGGSCFLKLCLLGIPRTHKTHYGYFGGNTHLTLSSSGFFRVTQWLVSSSRDDRERRICGRGTTTSRASPSSALTRLMQGRLFITHCLHAEFPLSTLESNCVLRDDPTRLFHAITCSRSSR